LFLTKSPPKEDITKSDRKGGGKWMGWQHDNDRCQTGT
jgi:hypothetical protein